MGKKNEPQEMVVRNVEYGDNNLEDIVLLQFVRWANDKKDIGILFKN